MNNAHRHKNFSWQKTNLSLMLAGLLLINNVRADENGHIRILQTQSQIVSDEIFVSAICDYELTSDMKEALFRGVPLHLLLELELKERRKYLPDLTAAAKHRDYQLKFHSLTRRYIVNAMFSDQQRSFSNLDSALAWLAHVDEWSLGKLNDLKSDAKYRLRLRARMEVRSLPRPLSTVPAWFKETQLATDWVKWSLAR